MSLYCKMAKMKAFCENISLLLSVINEEVIKSNISKHMHTFLQKYLDFEFFSNWNATTCEHANYSSEKIFFFY